MKKFVFLYYGFEPPAQEIQGAWSNWFAAVETSWLMAATHLDLEEKSPITVPKNCRWIAGQ